MRNRVKIAIGSAVVVVGLFVMAFASQRWPLSGGPVHGVVLDGTNNRPLADATVVVKWIGHLSGVHGPSYPCYHVALAQSSPEGHFDVPAWQMKRDDGPSWLRGMSTADMQAPLAVAAYKRGYFIERGPEPFAKDVIVLVKMEPFVGTVQERLSYLSGFIGQPIMCDADDKTLIPIYQAAYEEGKAIAKSPAELETANILLIGLESAQYGNSVALDRNGQRWLQQMRTKESERSK